jgi:hypothetical protein
MCPLHTHVSLLHPWLIGRREEDRRGSCKVQLQDFIQTAPGTKIDGQLTSRVQACLAQRWARVLEMDSLSLL